MPVFMIERNFAEALDIGPDDAVNVNRINGEIGVQWLVSFLSADKKKTYCLYEASSAEAIREAALRVGIPCDSIIEVGQLANTGMLTGVQKDRLTAH